MAINYMKYDLKRGGEIVEAEGKTYSLQIMSKKTKTRSKVSGGVPEVLAEVDIKATIKETDGLGNYFAIDEIPSRVTEKIENALKKAVEKKMMTTYEKCKTLGIDIYELFDVLYENNYKDFKRMADDVNYLEKIRFIVNAKISVVKK